jgi:glycosyltransferase involved in cell wall biosynthesis
MSPDPKRVRVAMLADNAFTADKRIYREAKALVDAGYDLTLYAMTAAGLSVYDRVDGIPVERVFTDKAFDVKSPGYLDALARRIADTKPDVLHCHDWVMLHVGVLVKRLLPRTILVYDSHELFHSWPIHYSSRRIDIVLKSWLVRRYLVAREKKDSRNIDRLITVSRSMADELETHFRLRFKPTVVRNFAEFEPVTERSDFVRRGLNIPTSDKVVVLFAHFIYRKQRNIETAIEQLANQPGIALVIFCANGGHKQFFIEWVRRRGFANVYFHDAIRPDRIVNYLASCDVGLVPTWNKKHASYWLGLENKLFHYVMSELPVLASAQPEHKRIVETHDVGVCVNGEAPNAFAEGLQKIFADYDRYKRNAAAAKHILCWENEKASLLNLYETLLPA